MRSSSRRNPMKRFRIAVLVLSITLAVTSPASAAIYAWSISKSGVDPFQNTGAPTGGIDTLFLWIWCSDQGWSAAEMTLEVNPAGQILAFTPGLGILNAGDMLHLLLAVGGCPPAPFVAGSILLFHTAPVTMCL